MQNYYKKKIIRHDFDRCFPSDFSANILREVVRLLWLLEVWLISLVSRDRPSISVVTGGDRPQ